jgi:hypothetical protein
MPPHLQPLRLQRLEGVPTILTTLDGPGDQVIWDWTTDLVHPYLQEWPRVPEGHTFRVYYGVEPVTDTDLTREEFKKAFYLIWAAFLDKFRKNKRGRAAMLKNEKEFEWAMAYVNSSHRLAMWREMGFEPVFHSVLVRLV